MSQKIASWFTVVSGLLLQIHLTSMSIIAPPWVASAANYNCSSISWQLLEWKKDGKCYHIYQQGPCPETQVITFDSTTGKGECKCPTHLLLWRPTNTCHPKFSRGPCYPGQYLDVSNQGESFCRESLQCNYGSIYWPSKHRCYRLYTQGPCHKGDLLIMNALTGEPYCGCDPLLLRQYYFATLGLCYEHRTRGPCEEGLVFTFNHTSGQTHCTCNNQLINYHNRSGKCFELNSKGPCNRGQVFQKQGTCGCRSGYLLLFNECFRPYTSGPCGDKHFMLPAGPKIGTCVSNPCPETHLYFPKERTKCFKVGSQGPCRPGTLVIFEKFSAGKSYKGECGCSEGYGQNYWPENAQCYEWNTRGPCNDSFIFTYNKKEGKTECAKTRWIETTHFKFLRPMLNAKQHNLSTTLTKRFPQKKSLIPLDQKKLQLFNNKINWPITKRVSKFSFRQKL